MTIDETARDELQRFLVGAENLLLDARGRLENSGVFIRSSDHRDIVYGAHISRMETTLKSIFYLCRLENSHDAAALSRTLMEYSTSLIYLVSHDDSVVAAQNFVYDGLTHMGEFNIMGAEYYPEVKATNLDMAHRAVELGRSSKYLSSTLAQLKLLKELSPDSHFDWYERLIYRDLSVYVHPRLCGLDAFAPTAQERFRLRTPFCPERLISCAAISFGLMLSAHVWICHAWGLSWGDQLLDLGVKLLDENPRATGLVGAFLPLRDIPQARRSSGKPKAKNKRK